MALKCQSPKTGIGGIRGAAMHEAIVPRNEGIEGLTKQYLTLVAKTGTGIADRSARTPKRTGLSTFLEHLNRAETSMYVLGAWSGP